MPEVADAFRRFAGSYVALLHVFHSCRNRACPKCHAEQTQAWLEQRRAEMLPVPYFHVTVTVPEELRAALHQQPHPGRRRYDRDLSLQGPRRRPPAQRVRSTEPARPPRARKL
jgi:Transposase zinc-binding domain